MTVVDDAWPRQQRRDPDAVEHLRAWHAAGIDLYVYSSGSVYAQKLLFGHTEYGDLTPLLQRIPHVFGQIL